MHRESEQTLEPRFTSDPEEYAALRETEHEAYRRGDPGHDEAGNPVPPVAMKPSPEDEVEEASWQSFPASDPPSWSGTSIS